MFQPDVHQSTAYYAFGQEQSGRLQVQAPDAYRYGYNGKEKDQSGEWGLTNYDYGARIYNPAIGRWLSVDPLAAKYPYASPYNFVLNTPIQAVDPDGRLVIFVNGFRPEQNPLTKKGSIFKNDKYGYWGNTDLKFMKRIRDYNALYVDGTSKALSPATKGLMAYVGRYESGVADGEAILKKIESGEIILKQGESIKIVSHSQGTALSAGITSVLTKAGYEVEVSYNIAPKQPGDIPVTGESRTVQYSSKWDIIAPQSEMKGADERAFTPDNAENGPIDGHLLGNYDWMFDIPKDKPGYVAPRKDTPKEKRKND